MVVERQCCIRNLELVNLFRERVVVIVGLIILLNAACSVSNLWAYKTLTDAHPLVRKGNLAMVFVNGAMAAILTIGAILL